ncbi:MAG: IS110 family transposase [Planctomycetes bacterium]|nr:IS110 family transposase [Planctomycetota bacterium]
MKYVGADLHKKSISFCVVEIVDRTTHVIQRRRILCQDVAQIKDFLRMLGLFQITVEATIGYDWFAGVAEKYAERVVIAHAGKLRIIAESTCKTDKIDARILAEFLAHNMIPEAWRATPRVRQHRSLVRRRQKIQSRITAIKNTIRGVLTRYNADRQDLFSKLGRLASQQLQLLAEERWLLEDLWEDFDEACRRLEKVEERLVRFASQGTIREHEARAVLATMPGVGLVTIDVLLAELGDWERFGSGDAVVAFAGLAPGVRESDGRRKDLRLTKAGSPLLRWVMVQLAHRMKRNSCRWQVVFDRLSQRVGKKKATCAIARRLLLVVYAMLRDGKAYQLPAAA